MCYEYLQYMRLALTGRGFAMGTKYELTSTTREWAGRTLYQVAYADGTLGGFIESEKNLSQEGSCRVYGNALVWDNARVVGDAQVSGAARVFGDAKVSGDAWVYGNAKVYGAARVFGDALVWDNARVSGNALVYGDAQVFGNAWVSGNALVSLPSDCICLTGFQYIITCLPKGAQIGCQFKTYAAWLKVTKKEAAVMGLQPEQFKGIIALLKAMTIHRKELKKCK
jgi:hypothetical protein